MNVNKYRCSIVVPVRNGEEFIEDCLHSILNQDTDFPYEIILINDNSTDSTLEILMKFASQFQNITILNSVGSGIASALNQGILAANSELIIRMDADDRMVRSRISMQLAHFEQHDDCVLLGGQINVFGNSSTLPTPNVYPSSHEGIMRMLSKGNAFAHPTVAFKRDAAISVGLYDSKFNGAEDYELWTRLAGQGRFHNLTQILVHYRIHPQQVTKSRLEQVQRMTYATQCRWIFRSSPRVWSLPLQKVALYKLMGAVFLLSRISRDLLVRLKNEY